MPKQIDTYKFSKIHCFKIMSLLLIILSQINSQLVLKMKSLRGSGWLLSLFKRESRIKDHSVWIMVSGCSTRILSPQSSWHLVTFRSQKEEIEFSSFSWCPMWTRPNQWKFQVFEVRPLASNSTRCHKKEEKTYLLELIHLLNS